MLRLCLRCLRRRDDESRRSAGLSLHTTAASAPLKLDKDVIRPTTHYNIGNISVVDGGPCPCPHPHPSGSIASAARVPRSSAAAVSDRCELNKEDQFLIRATFINATRALANSLPCKEKLPAKNNEYKLQRGATRVGQRGRLNEYQGKTTDL